MLSALKLLIILRKNLNKTSSKLSMLLKSYGEIFLEEDLFSDIFVSEFWARWEHSFFDNRQIIQFPKDSTNHFSVFLHFCWAFLREENNTTTTCERGKARVQKLQGTMGAKEPLRQLLFQVAKSASAWFLFPGGSNYWLFGLSKHKRNNQ